MKLRDYQVECVNQIGKMSSGRKICYMATGAGKTIVIATVAKYTKGRVLIIVDQQELREQTIDKIKMICGEDVSIGSVQGKLDEVDKRIVICTRQSLTHCKSDRLERLIENGNFEIVMTDECHRAVGQIKQIIDKINAIKVIGFSATPWNPQLKELFDGFVYEKDTLSLIEEGYLCNPVAFRIKTSTDLSDVKTVGGEFNQGQLSDTVDNIYRNQLIVKAYKDMAIDRKHTIVFATSIDHAYNLSQCFNINGISAKSIDSTLDSVEREQVLNDFKEGKFKVLVNVAILTTGFDMESLDCIIMARPTKSKILYTQCLGRGLRIAENKENCLILDIVDNYSRHSLIDMKSIFDTEDGESILEAKERKVYEQVEKERQLEEQRKIEEEQERIRLEEIKLFNRNIFNISQISNLDWYFGKINNNHVAILSSNSNEDYYIFKSNGEYQAYKYTKLENYNFKLDLIETNENLMEIVQKIDNEAILKGSSFINKKSRWKKDSATVKQIRACKSLVNSKWDAHQYFSKRSMYFSLKEILC